VNTPHQPGWSDRRAHPAHTADRPHRARAARRARRWSAARLATAVGSFLRSLRTRRPETRGTYERALQEFLRWSGRRTGLRLTVDEIKTYKRYLTRQRGLSDVSVSTYLTAVRRLCGYLQRTGALDGNPALEVAGNPRPRTHARKALSIAEARTLLELLGGEDERGLRDAAVIRLMLRCALSDAEIVRLNLGDLRHGDGGWLLAVQGKGKATKDAAVDLPADVSDALQAYLRRRTGTSENEPLFLSAGNSSRGRRMTTRAVRDRVNEYLEQAGIRTARTRQRVTPRSLRHTAALLLAAEGAQPDDIRKRLRLGTLQTVQVYLQASRNQTSHHHAPGNRSGT
jgi:integrase/recombinase XerC